MDDIRAPQSIWDDARAEGGPWLAVRTYAEYREDCRVALTLCAYNGAPLEVDDGGVDWERN